MRMKCRVQQRWHPIAWSGSFQSPLGRVRSSISAASSGLEDRYLRRIPYHAHSGCAKSDDLQISITRGEIPGRHCRNAPGSAALVIDCRKCQTATLTPDELPHIEAVAILRFDGGGEWLQALERQKAPRKPLTNKLLKYVLRMRQQVTIPIDDIEPQMTPNHNRQHWRRARTNSNTSSLRGFKGTPCFGPIALHLRLCITS
jgi:hypothetical protein